MALHISKVSLPIVFFIILSIEISNYKALNLLATIEQSLSAAAVDYDFVFTIAVAMHRINLNKIEIESSQIEKKEGYRNNSCSCGHSAFLCLFSSEISIFSEMLTLCLD